MSHAEEDQTAKSFNADLSSTIRVLVLGFTFGGVLGYIVFTWENADYNFKMRSDTSPDRADFGNLSHEIKNSSVAEEIAEKIKVLCWVPTFSKKLSSVSAIHQTWGSRCDTLLFVANQSGTVNGGIEITGLPVREGRKYLWSKTKESLKHIYKQYLDKADWFLKADDDTYVVIENLKYFLRNKNTSLPIQFGSKLEIHRDYLSIGDYMYGGAGYVLSKEALRRFVEDGLPNGTICARGEIGNEDLLLSEALMKLGVELGDTRDSVGSATFLPGVLAEHLTPKVQTTVYWIWSSMVYKHKRGVEYCSKNVISFHKVSCKQMLFVDYMIYRFRAFGLDWTALH